MKPLRILYTVLFLAIFLTGCLPASLPQKQPPPTDSFAPQNMNSADLQKETKELTKASTDKKATTIERAEAHRRLAILYLIPRNPESNLKTAAKELGKYLEMTPYKLDNCTAANWVTALKSGKEYQSLQRKVTALNKKVQKQNKKNKALANSNAALKQTIEQLKKLDLSLEKKRRNLR